MNYEGVLQPCSQGEDATLDLVRLLCDALKLAGVAYCHWKSNDALDRSASGDNDLDLLIGRSDAHRFTEILYRLGFKEARAPLGLQLPGVLDYYGYDGKADKFVHVHAHYQLIVGHDRTKNYHLPIEKAFLASATQGNLFRVPTPAFEFIVFIIRMVLKYSTWDAIFSGSGALPAAAKQELEYLEPRADKTQVYDVLNQYLPYIGKTRFDACVQSLQANSPIWVRVNAGRKLQKTLRAYTRHSQALDIYLKIWRRVAGGARRRIFGRLPGKRLSSGGALIALVGGDGAGKSTAVCELYAWLSKDFDTLKVHLGRPPWSWRTYMIRGMLKFAGSLSERPKRESSEGATVNSAVRSDYPQMLRHVCTARDRYWTYAKARRFVENGGIVICDRFTLPQIKLMDGPQLERLVEAGQGNPFIRLLARLEKSWYSRMARPDMLIVLEIDPEIAVRRKTDEDPDSVRTRATEISQLNWQEIGAHVIDASQPKANVLSDLKSVVWSEI